MGRTLKPRTVTNELAGLSESEILAHIKALREPIAETSVNLAWLYAQRVALFAEGRRRRPPVPIAVLGKAAGVSDTKVSNVLKRNGS